MKVVAERGTDFGTSAILIGLFALVLVIGGVAMTFGGNITSSFEKMFADVADSKYAPYENGSNHQGTSVIAMIENAEVPDPLKLEIVVRTTRNIAASTSTSYGYDNQSDTSYASYSVTDPDSADYIRPAGIFTVTQQTSNGEIIGFTFSQVN